MTHARPIASGLHAVYDEKGASITRRRRHALTRLQIVRDVYRAFASGDRSLIEQTFADDFTFSSPLDVGLDRAGYFNRCWSGAGQGQRFDFVRIVESGDEVIVTYEVTKVDGGRGRNTEIFTFSSDKIRRVEVYFGWNVN
jgi:SnoaL-like domain